MSDWDRSARPVRARLDELQAMRASRDANPRCPGYIPAEYYGSICDDCGRSAGSHRAYRSDLDESGRIAPEPYEPYGW